MKNLFKALPELNYLVISTFTATLLSHMIYSKYDSDAKEYIFKGKRDVLLGDIEWFIWFLGHFTSFILLIWGIYWVITSLIFSLVLKKSAKNKRFKVLKKLLVDNWNGEDIKISKGEIVSLTQESFILKNIPGDKTSRLLSIQDIFNPEVVL